MIAALRCVVLDCPEPRSLAEFYRSLLGGNVDQQDRRRALDDSWATLHTPLGAGPRLPAGPEPRAAAPARSHPAAAVPRGPRRPGPARLRGPGGPPLPPGTTRSHGPSRGPGHGPGHGPGRGCQSADRVQPTASTRPASAGRSSAKRSRPGSATRTTST
ncbi:VOC family protein [Streptomyces sp. NPDC048331]|uniref:VOC family protein n=1 Tax=Streptomyces sp. NPDC048331 TaxID=3365534 RepID=UPI003719F19E